MRRFEAALSEAGHTFARIRIPVPAGGGSMVTDTFVRTTGTLWEIKASSDRASVRMALGQLSDYLRFAAPFGCQASGVVLPEDPGSDLKNLIRSAGHSMVIARDDVFLEWVGPAVSEQWRVFPRPKSL
jgi:hypothetical protein